jgi:hypothetical protein
MIDILGDIVSYYTGGNASALATALGDTNLTSVMTDFDPQNVSRPYVIVLQSHYDNDKEVMGRAFRIDKTLVQFLVFTDTRAECVSLLDTLEATYIVAPLQALGAPKVLDKVCQLDLNHIDAYKGTLNLEYRIQQTQA